MDSPMRSVGTRNLGIKSLLGLLNNLEVESDESNRLVCVFDLLSDIERESDLRMGRVGV